MVSWQVMGYNLDAFKVDFVIFKDWRLQLFKQIIQPYSSISQKAVTTFD